MRRRNFVSLLPIILSLAIVGCAADTQNQAVEYFDDTAITTKVKSKLFDDPQTSGFAIGVKTYQGTVQLSGFVTSDKEKDRAAELTKGVPGVKSVKNDLIVKNK